MPRKSRLAKRAARRQLAGKLANAIRPAEQRYVRALRNVSKAWHTEYSKALGPILGQVARGDGVRLDMKTVHNELAVLGVRIQIAIPRVVGPLFDRMGNEIKKQNAKGMALLGVRPTDAGLDKLLERKRAENIDLLTQAHKDYADQLRDILDDPDNFGLRVEDLADKLAERGDVSESRAELIARDQTLKTNADISQERMQAAGVDAYTWSTSLDERVREEHAALEGQTFTWDSPPEPGHPGDDIQCRCVAIPVGIEELDDVFG